MYLFSVYLGIGLLQCECVLTQCDSPIRRVVGWFLGLQNPRVLVDVSQFIPQKLILWNDCRKLLVQTQQTRVLWREDSTLETFPNVCFQSVKEVSDIRAGTGIVLRFGKDFILFQDVKSLHHNITISRTSRGIRKFVSRTKILTSGFHTLSKCAGRSDLHAGPTSGCWRVLNL